MSKHNDFAPYWAVGLFIFGGTGLATIWIDLGAFWKGYVLELKAHSILIYMSQPTIHGIF